MYSIARDSLFSPKNLIKYHKKSGFYVFLYFLILILFMSLGGFVFFASYGNGAITEANTGCNITDNTFVCDGANYDSSTAYDLYGFPLYILNANEDVAAFTTDKTGYTLVLQNSSLSFYLNGSHYTSVDLLNSNLNINNDFTKAISIVSTVLFVAGMIFTIIQNVIILLFIILISTITFLRLKKFITYKKIFKLVVFASTPVALLMTIFSLIPFGDFVFIILMFIAYRSIFILQRELYMQTMLREAQKQSQATQSNSPENVDDIEDVEVVDDETKDDDEDNNKDN